MLSSTWKGPSTLGTWRVSKHNLANPHRTQKTQCSDFTPYSAHPKYELVLEEPTRDGEEYWPTLTLKSQPFVLVNSNHIPSISPVTPAEKNGRLSCDLFMWECFSPRVI